MGVSVFPVPCSGALLDPTKPCSARPRHPHQLQALRKLQSAKRPASAPSTGSQRKRSLQNIIKSKLPNKAKGTGLADWLRLPNPTDGQDQWEGSVDDPFLFPNPVPPEMQAVSMAELAAVEINWRMLTMARNIDISFFSRLVELTRLKLATTRKEEKERLVRGVNDPDILVKRPPENPGGMTVTIFKCARLAVKSSAMEPVSSLITATREERQERGTQPKR